MKSKIKILTIVLLCAAVYSEAQQLSAGIAAGVSTGSVKITEIPGGFANTVKGDNINGFEAGLFARYSFSALYVKPMALYSFRHGKVDAYKDETVIQTSNYSLNRFLVPVMFGIKIIGPFGLEAGPVYNYVISSTNDIAGNEIQINKSGIGYRVGASAEIRRVNLSVSYQGIKNRSSSGVSAYSTPDELIFGLGIRLGK